MTFIIYYWNKSSTNADEHGPVYALFLCSLTDVGGCEMIEQWIYLFIIWI